MASTSLQSQEHHQPDKLSKVKVTILASEWGSSKGGLSTLNRELATQLAKLPEVEITFFLPRCDEEDKKEAFRLNVKVVEARLLPGFEELDCLCFPPEDLQIDIVIGHGIKLGHQAQQIRKCKNCKWVQMVHSDPEELGMFTTYAKRIPKSEEKHKTEVKLCEMADLVIGVGPKLSEAFRLYLRGFREVESVLDFTPGVFDEFVGVEQSCHETRHCSALVFGHSDDDDDEDFELKGFDIAGKAIAKLPDTHLLFVGAPDGKKIEIRKRLIEFGVPKTYLKVRSFVQSRDDLKRLFQEVDLVLMPSRTEGFGLTGLEALSAGLLVLVSKNSGFGEALCKIPFGSTFVIDSEDPEEWAAAIKKVWNKGRQKRLVEAKMLRTSYGEKYNWAKQSRGLLDKMISMVHGASDVQADIEQRNADTKRRTECVVRENVKSLKPDHCKVRQGVMPCEAEIRSSSVRQISPEIAYCEADIAFFGARHDRDTRQWLFKDFDKWFSDPGDSRAYVLLGDAGIGKSVIAAALAQRARKAGNLGAAYFCRHNDGTRNDPRYLLGTIARQLSDCNSEFCTLVGGEDGVKMMLANSKFGVKELFTKLLEEPLGSCSPCQQCKLVIVDALDETEYESREDFLYVIKKALPRLPQWLLFFITSRPEDTVQSRFETYKPCVRICAGDSKGRGFYLQHEQDIQLFLQKEVDFSYLPYSVEDVTKKCNGLFLYAFYISKVLKDSVYSDKTHRASQQNDLFPGDIDDFFRENFQRVFDKVGADLYRKLLGCIIVAPSPLPVSFISFLINTENADLDEQEAVDAVSLFVVRTPDQTMTFLHSLIPIWLTDKKKAPRRLFIDTKIAVEYLRMMFIDILSTIVEETSATLPFKDEDLERFVMHFAIRFLCHHVDKNSLTDVFSWLTSYQFLEKRIQSGRIEVFHLIEDFQLASSCLAVEDTQKKNILQEISSALNNDFHVLVECPHLFRSCVRNASDAVQKMFSIPQVSVPSLEWNIIVGRTLYECNCFATASDKKTLAGAKGHSLLFFDASTLETLSGPFEISQDMIRRINHLEFSPDNKFVFFGRLDKWFSVGRGCVEDFSQFSGNPLQHDWGLIVSNGQHIVVKRSHFSDLLENVCLMKRCIKDLLSLWAIKEIDQDLGKEWTCSFGQLSKMVAEVGGMGSETIRLLDYLDVKVRPGEVNATQGVSNDRSCYFCDKLHELTDPNKEPSLASVRQLITELYPWVFRYQVWNLETGRPLLQHIFNQGALLNPFTYFCHVTSAFDEWGTEIGCAGVHQVMSVVNIAVVTAIEILFRGKSDWPEREYRWLQKWVVEGLEKGEEYSEEGLEELMEELMGELMGELERWMHEPELVYTKMHDQALEMVMKVKKAKVLSCSPKLKDRKYFIYRILQELRRFGLWQRTLQLDLVLFYDSFKRDVFQNFPKGFLGLIGNEISHCVSPRKMWMVNRRNWGEIHLLRTGIQEQDYSDYSSEKEEYRITQVECLTFTYDDLYVIYLSHEESLHALSLQTGTVFTSVSGRNYLYFTRDRQVGYLFRSGTEERAIFLTSLLEPCKFFPVKREEVGETTAAIFTSSDTVKCISSESLITSWRIVDYKCGYSFESISNSPLAGSRLQVVNIQNFVFSPDGKLVAFQQGTRIMQSHVEEFWDSLCTVFKADSIFTDLRLTFSPDGIFLLFSIHGNCIGQLFYIWDVQTKTLSKSFTSPWLLTIDSFCISSDNRNLILCGEYEIEIWEFSKYPRHLLKRIGVERSYNPVRFSQCVVSQDNQLLICCLANVIFVHNLQVADLHSSKRVLLGHLGKIEFCKFLKRNRYLITYAVDGMVFLWDVEESKAIAFARIAKGREKILRMAVSPGEDRAVCFISPSGVCVLSLYNLKCSLPAEFTPARKGRISTGETSLHPVGQIPSTSNIPTSCLEDDQPGGFSSPDLEETSLLIPDNLLDSDESDDCFDYNESD